MRALTSIVIAFAIFGTSLPVVSVATSSEASAKSKHHSSCWRTNRTTHTRFRIC